MSVFVSVHAYWRYRKIVEKFSIRIVNAGRMGFPIFICQNLWLTGYIIDGWMDEWKGWIAARILEFGPVYF